MVPSLLFAQPTMMGPSAVLAVVASAQGSRSRYKSLPPALVSGRGFLAGFHIAPASADKPGVSASSNNPGQPGRVVARVLADLLAPGAFPPLVSASGVWAPSGHNVGPADR